jgi:hypothetical protein
MVRRLIVLLSLAGGLVLLWPTSSHSDPVAIVQDRVYRAGVQLVVDTLIENRTANPMEGVEVLVEFRNFFGELVSVEYTVAAPPILGPGHVAALRVVTPFSEAVRKLYYRFTWRHNGEQTQTIMQRDIWKIGSTTRDPGRWP